MKLLVSVYKYQESGASNSNRRKLTIIPFSGNNTHFSQQLTFQVEELLVQSRRFSILDRTKRAAIEREQALWRSDRTPITEKTRLGQVLGVDYMLFGQVVESNFEQWLDTQPLTGETKQHSETSVVVRYEMLSVATQQVKWVNTVTIKEQDVGLEDAAI